MIHGVWLADDKARYRVILDAEDISGELVAVVKLPQRVPNGLHGNWYPMEP